MAAASASRSRSIPSPVAALPRHQIDLVQHQPDAPAARGGCQPRGDGPHRVGRTRLRVDQEKRHIGFRRAAPGGGHHRAVEPAAGAENARRVDQQDLRRTPQHDPEHAQPRGLRLRADDRELCSRQPVQERGFAGIRRTQDRRIAAAR